MLDGYFIGTDLPAKFEQGSYSLSLVLLSFVVASIASYTGVILATLMPSAQTKPIRNIIHGCGALSWGSGIWSMHFIGMIAYKTTMDIYYDATLTILSMVVAILIAGCVLQIVNVYRFSWWRNAFAAILLGLAICLMHYLGMGAMHMDAELRFIPSLYALSVLIAVVASFAALRIVHHLATQATAPWQRTLHVIASMTLALAICGMHYTVMAAARIMPNPLCQYRLDQDHGGLIFLIVSVTSIIIGIAVTLAYYFHAKKENVTVYNFPTRLCVSALVLTVLSIIWADGSQIYASNKVAQSTQHYLTINNNLQEIARHYIDLEQKIGSTADDTDLQMLENYDQDIMKFEHDLDATKKRANAPESGENLSHLTQIIHAFEALIKKASQSAANNLMARPDSLAQNKVLQNFLLNNHQLLRINIQDIGQTELQHERANINKDLYLGLYLSLVVFLILPLVNYLAYRALKLWREEMHRTQAVLIQRDIDLSKTIGELEIAHQAEEKSKILAERSNAAKSEFLANMSHEIRTPMNAILGMAQLLINTDLTIEQKIWAEVINNSGNNLMRIINDILDFSKIESGELKMEARTFDLNKSLAKIADLITFKAAEKKIDFYVKITPGKSNYVVGDKYRLKQAITNLLSNALKFTETGSVTLEVNVVPEDQHNDRIFVAVRDTGIGIPADKINYIFEKFTQAEESTSRRFGGTGLGLAISQQLIRLMGSDGITVSSEIGIGSCFAFQLLLPHAQSLISTLPDTNLIGLRVMMICDNSVTSATLAGYTTSWGMISTIYTPKEMRAQFIAGTMPETPYDFVYIDLKNEFGDDNKYPNCLQQIPVLAEAMNIMILSFGVPFSSENLAARNISALLTNPVLPDQLHDVFCILRQGKLTGKQLGIVTRSTIAHTVNDTTPPEGAAQATPKEVNILVAEDIWANQLLMKTLLQKLGCKIQIANNGQESLQKLKQTPFDLVFMDCHMPEMDGFAATKAWRENEGWQDRHIPIVALTADAMTGDREKCLAAGMDDYLNKPFKLEEITDMIAKWVGQEHRA
jgi:signal transduction histidine kinase/NO-binding membrane sensor protein with MHYT domain/CheY-like chemotaxis protein